MNTIKFSNLIKESLMFYDNQNLKYKHLLESKKYQYKGDIIFHDSKNKETKKYKYEILGAFFSKTNVWMWGWMLIGDYSPISESLLKYGLRIDNKMITDRPEFFFIKTQLINSRFLLDNYIHLDIHLALASYLIKDKSIFVCPIKQIINETEPDNYIIKYLIIKK